MKSQAESLAEVFENPHLNFRQKLENDHGQISPWLACPAVFGVFGPRGQERERTGRRKGMGWAGGGASPRVGEQEPEESVGRHGMGRCGPATQDSRRASQELKGPIGATL